jgi:hypothetical protein
MEHVPLTDIRLEAMISIARSRRRRVPARSVQFAMTVLFAVNVPTA